MQTLEGDAAPALLADDADQMHERAAALHARGEPIGLQHVAGHAVDGFEALEVRLGARPDEAADEKTLRKKCADDRLADEAGPAGHEHALRHGRIVARAGAPRFSRGGVYASPYHRAMRFRSAGLWLPVLLLPVMVVAARPAPVPAQPVTWQLAVDEAIRDSVASSEIPGAVLVVGQGDQILHRKVLGWRATVPHPELMTADTIFDIASLTKVIATAPSVLRLWELGKIDLNAPLGRYLKEFDTAAFQDVTVMRLLTHSAGMNDLPSREAMTKGFPEAGRIQARAGLAVPPGTTFLYSDTGFILLGELVRRVSGEPLDTFARKQFYAPLGMRDTAFDPPAAWRKRIAPTEAVNNQGPLRGVVHDGNARLLRGIAGHAGLFSTASDLSRFCRMLLAGGQLGGRRYLKEATVKAMFAPHVIGESTRGLGWDISSPYSRTLGAYFPMDVGGPHRVHRHRDLDGSGDRRVHDPAHQSRPSLRQGRRGRAAPADQRRGRYALRAPGRADGRGGGEPEPRRRARRRTARRSCPRAPR